jgi:cell division protein FtsB
MPEVLTVRLIVLAVVVMIAAVLLVPTVRAWVQQTSETNELRAELAAHEAERDALDRELARWDDESYVVGQARDRLSFVMPGDHVWRVLDADSVVEDVDPVTGKPVSDGVVGTEGDSDRPWYTTLWESVQVADGPTPAASTQPSTAPSTAPAPSSGTSASSSPAPSDG